MATFNSPSTSTSSLSTSNVFNSCVKPPEAVQSTPAATFFVPSPSQLIGLNTPSFPVATTATSSTIGVENQSYIGIQQQHQHQQQQQKTIPSLTTHHQINSSSSFTFMEIKREPCQVSEVTTSNNLHTNHNCASMSSTMTTLVKIESTSPKISDLDKTISEMHTNNCTQVGMTLARKRPQDTMPVQPPRDLNCFGIRVADIGGVPAAGCGNIYFAGGPELIPGAISEDINSVHENRASTFWQCPTAIPIESVISMSTVGLQYARDPSRGQLVLLPTTSAIESFPQAAFLWPPYMQQNTSAIQAAPNFIFPSMSPQTSSLPTSYTTPLQLLGHNYLTAAATSSTVCHHSQATGSRFLSMSSDTRRTEISQKHNAMKMEDFFQPKNYNKVNLASNYETFRRVEKPKDDEPTYSLPTPNLIAPAPPLMQNEQPHILLDSVHSPPELLSIPIMPSNYTIPTNMAPIPTPQPEDIGTMNKNLSIRVSGFTKTPEMQDVNIQTDIPVCSDDERSLLEPSSVDFISCNSQQPSDKIQSTSTVCHNNNVCSSKTQLSKENSPERLEQCTTTFDLSKPTSTVAPNENYDNDNECSLSSSANKTSCYPIDNSPLVLPSDEFKSSENPAPPKSPNNNSTSFLEMSGLELLSNISTGAFVDDGSFKGVCVKQEPLENNDNKRTNDYTTTYESYVTNNNCNTSDISHPELNEKDNYIDSFKASSSPKKEKTPLGGLNLLCALAEQRIQEEVANSNLNTRSKSPHYETKKKKYKHAKSKSSRHLLYCKEGKKCSKERRKHASKSDCEDEHINLCKSYKKNKWANPEDLFKAMESDMKMQLADITRQYKKKKRKLDEMYKIKKRKKSSEYKFANISCKNPSFICFLDKFHSSSPTFPLPTTTNSTQMKSSLNIQNQNISESELETKDSKDSLMSSRERDGSSSIKLNIQKSSENSVFSDKKCSKDKKLKTKHMSSSLSSSSSSLLKFEGINLEGRPRSIKFKQPELQDIDQLQETQQLNLNQEQKQQQQQQQLQQKQTLEKKNNKFDKEILLSNEHLYQKETRVLTDMGGLFYAGTLKPLQPPDVYAITLDGERGNKSHIMSREEIFKDTILEVVPKSVKNVPTGTRLCAYWSQQYRCLYPGRAIDSENADEDSDFVSVEFDDGDSGRIRLQNVRFLLSDYPIVEYNANPFNNLGKNKKSNSMKMMQSDIIISNESNEESMAQLKVNDEEDHIPFSDNSRIDETKNQFEKNPSHLKSSRECVHKHSKHRKKKKHKNHQRKSSSAKNAITASDGNTKKHKKTKNLLTEEDMEEQQKFNKKKSSSIIKKVEIDQPKMMEIENVKPALSVAEDEDSVSNAISEASDEMRNDNIGDNRGKGSKIAAFLPERQLWSWFGQAYRKATSKGRARKQFYKSIARGKETITVGECAVFLSTGRPDRPYIGRIEAMWETTSSNKIVRVRWFYHPEETVGCPTLKYPGALFDSPHEDENDVQTISHRCEVVEFSVYIAKFGTDFAQYQSIYDNNDTYYLSGYYNPRLQVLKIQPDIPTLDDTRL